METTLFNLPDLNVESDDTPETATRPTTRPDLHLHYVGLAHFFAAYEPRPRRPERQREPEPALACR